MLRPSNRIVCVLGCLVLTIFAQTAAYGQNSNPIEPLWSNLRNIYVQSNLLNTTDASEVEAMLRGAIERASTAYGASSAEVLQTTFELSKLYKMQARFGELRSQLDKIAQIYSKLPPVSKALFTSRLTDFAIELAQQGRTSEAELLTNPLIESLKSQQSDLDNKEALNKLGSLAVQFKTRKDYASAEPLYRALISNYEQRKPLDQLALANMRTQLAELLKENNRLSAAQELALLAYEGQNRPGTPACDTNTNTLMLLTSLDLATEKPQEAKELVDKLDGALGRPMIPNRNSLLNPILELCTQFAQVNDYQSVKTLFTRSLNFANQYSYSQYESSLKEITKALVNAGSFSKAEGLYLELEVWAEKPDSNTDNRFRASVLTMLAKFYTEAAMYDKLERTLTKLADYDAEHKTTNLANLQSTIDATNNVAAREKLYLLLAKVANPSNRRQSAIYRAKLAEIYLLGDHWEEAKKQWFQITQMLQESVPQDCKEISDEVRLVLDAYIKDKRYNDAQQLANNMASYGFDKNILVSIANGFSALATHQDSLGNTEKAAQLVERALQVAEKYGGKLTYNYFDALNQYSALLRKSGKTQLADDKNKEAADLQKELQKRGINRYG